MLGVKPTREVVPVPRERVSVTCAPLTKRLLPFRARNERPSSLTTSDSFAVRQSQQPVLKSLPPDLRMKKQSAKSTLEVQGTEVIVLNTQDGDFISLTDTLKAKDGEFFISDWLRNRHTVEFLGIWES